VKVTRRQALKAGLAAALGSHRAFGSPAPRGGCTPAPCLEQFDWINKHLNVSETVWRYYDVWNRTQNTRPIGPEAWRPGFARLQGIVEQAQVSNRRVRAVGGRWSLSCAAVCPDIMINTMPLNLHAVGLQPDYVSSSDVNRERLVFAQCGASVLELSQTLERRGLSLPTSGASNGQTICGAFSTGTHGSARRVGAMQDYIVGLHVIAEDGRHHWIERRSRPVVSEAFCDYLGARLTRDDHLFQAAVVSFGSFGVIHAVLFEAVPIYLLEVHRKFYDWPDVVHAASTLETDGIGLPYSGVEPFHFEIALDPYRTRKGQHGAFVTAMYKQPFHEVPKPVSSDGKLLPGVDLLTVAGGFTSALPISIPAVVGALFKATCVPTNGTPKLGTHGDVFDATLIKGKSLSTEIGVDLGDARAAVDILVEVAQAYHFPGVLALRYVQRSDAYLAFTRFNTTCTIEIPAAGSTRTHNYYERVWQALEAHDIPFTLHWGQVNDTNRNNVAQRWGSSAADWLNARRAFLGPAGRAMFANEMLSQCGLDA
jgi:hypothetical protein